MPPEAPLLRPRRPPMVFESQAPQTPEIAAFFSPAFRSPAEIVTDGVIFLPALGNCAAFICDDRILLVDTAVRWFAPQVIEGLRSHSQATIDAIIYTHGHIDHTTGAPAFLPAAHGRGA